MFDLGFGDAGKGATVDYLVRARGAELVARWNGGAQAGHTVVAPDGRRHTFAQLGAGSFVPGVGTHLGPDFVLHPGGLLVEAARLAARGVEDALARLSVDARALVISPFQQAAGRLRELLRGPARHGTCGVGVGEAVADALADQPDVLRAGDLADEGLLLARLAAQQRRKRAELAAARELDDPRAAPELGLLLDPAAPARALALWAGFPREVLLSPQDGAARLRACRRLVLEGAQGLLLDQTWGFHPHTTWSDVTPRGAHALLDEAGWEGMTRRLGVLRAYATRHGEGPFPTHDPALDAALPEPDNPDTGWQGPFRRGALDLVLARYALEVAGGACGLALTCLDRIEPEVALCEGYALGARSTGLELHADDGAGRTRLRPGPPAELEWRSALGALLGAARPRLRRVAREELPACVAEALGAPVWLTAWGPRAADRVPLPGPLEESRTGDEPRARR
ncbi:MAG: adenylosuccinate synthetase [Planctomycetota bacterium]